MSIVTAISAAEVSVSRREVQVLLHEDDARLPVRAVITTGRAVDPDQIEAAGNVRVVTSAPHREILPESAVVITHAGHGTVLKTLAAGVPLVCVPMGRDQADNTVRVLRLVPAYG